MKKTPLVLAGTCLVLGMFGCQTDDGVQKGYLTPSQTSSTASTETSTTTTTTTDNGSTTSERLPPPSATESVPTSDSSSTTSTTSSTSETTSTPEASESSTTTTETTKTSTPAPSASGESPPALAQNKQQIGGKSGGTGASIKRSSERDSVEKETPEPEERAVATTSDRRRVEAELDANEDVAAAKKPASSSAVSSSLSSGTTRVADPTGSAKGVVLNVNLSAKFVVVKFNYRAIPSLGKVLSVMRNGEKVGQIKITKPIKPPHATADILDGDIRRGDVVE